MVFFRTIFGVFQWKSAISFARVPTTRRVAEYNGRANEAFESGDGPGHCSGHFPGSFLAATVFRFVCYHLTLHAAYPFMCVAPHNMMFSLFGVFRGNQFRNGLKAPPSILYTSIIRRSIDIIVHIILWYGVAAEVGTYTYTIWFNFRYGRKTHRSPAM